MPFVNMMICCLPFCPRNTRQHRLLDGLKTMSGYRGNFARNAIQSSVVDLAAPRFLQLGSSWQAEILLRAISLTI